MASFFHRDNGALFEVPGRFRQHALQAFDDMVATGWTCSHETGHIWEVILPDPSISMLLLFKDLQPSQSPLSLREFLA